MWIVTSYEETDWNVESEKNEVKAHQKETDRTAST